MKQGSPLCSDLSAEMLQMASDCGTFEPQHRDEAFLAWLGKHYEEAFLAQLEVIPQVCVETVRFASEEEDNVEMPEYVAEFIRSSPTPAPEHRPPPAMPQLMTRHPGLTHLFVLCPVPGTPDEMRDLWSFISTYRNNRTRGLILWNCPPPSWAASYVGWRDYRRRHPHFTRPTYYRSTQERHCSFSSNLTTGDDHSLAALLLVMIQPHNGATVVVEERHRGNVGFNYALWLAIGRQASWNGHPFIRYPRAGSAPYVHLRRLWMAVARDEWACRLWHSPTAMIALIGVTAQDHCRIRAGSSLWDWMSGFTLKGLAAEVGQWPLVMQQCVRRIVIQLAGPHAQPLVDPYRYALLRVAASLPPGTIANLPSAITSQEIWTMFAAHFDKQFPIVADPLPPEHFALRPHSATRPASTLLDDLRREAHHVAWYLQSIPSPRTMPVFAYPPASIWAWPVDPEALNAQGHSIWGWAYSAPIADYPDALPASCPIHHDDFWTLENLVPLSPS